MRTARAAQKFNGWPRFSRIDLPAIRGLARAYDFARWTILRRGLRLNEACLATESPSLAHTPVLVCVDGKMCSRLLDLGRLANGARCEFVDHRSVRRRNIARIKSRRIHLHG